jgi:hypothetical protein
VTYLLDVYCLLRYESSPALKDALLNNLLVNLKGLAGAFHEADLLQEHFNLWLEDYIQKHGGDFDDHFFRNLIAPNVFHFLSIKDHFQIAYDLVPRSKSHTSPSTTDELKTLIKFYEQQELHLCVPSRTRGHAVCNTLTKGYDVLDMGKLDTYLNDTMDHMEIIRLILSARADGSQLSGTMGTKITTSNTSNSDSGSDCETTHSGLTCSEASSIISGTDDVLEQHIVQRWRARKDQCDGIVDEDENGDNSDGSLVDEMSDGEYDSEGSVWIN